MPQLGVLFDTNKLGTGFYGYTSFRIFFTMLRPEDLAGCTILHGELEGRRSRSYCIAVESTSFEVLADIRRKVAESTARALMPEDYRFLDDYGLEGEHLVEAVQVTETGELVERCPRWLYEAWQRSALSPAPQAVPAQVKTQVKPAPAARPAPEPKHGLRLPERVPFPLWWSHHGRRSFALMIAFCCGGALLPWLGCGVSLCIILTMAGLVQGIAMQWRVWTEQQLSGGELVEELKKFAAVRPLDDLVQRLEKPGPQASPLLRTLQSVTRSWVSVQDPAVVAAIVEQNQRTEGHMQRADNEELRFLAWAVPAMAVCSFYGMQIFVGVRESWLEAPKLALAGVAGWLVVQGLRCSVSATGERLWGDIQRLAIAAWLPVLQKQAPAARGAFEAVTIETESLEKALRDLSGQLESVREVLERQQEQEFAGGMTELRASIDRLAPVVAGIRDNHHGRPKAMTATA
ncbi:MAG: hypothetical protein SFV51_26900 [Bryobacteraceae bacterium]|nr:hypothetical protein [Bryobacteraceae bacterium]